MALTDPLPAPATAHTRGNLLSTLAPIWIAVVVVGVLSMASTRAVPPNDFWWHMKAGETLASTGHIPTVDTYSYIAAGRAYPSYATFWLADLLFYFLYRWGGLPLVITANAVAVTLAYTLLLVLCRHLAGSWPLAAFSAVYAVLLGFTNWNVRPQGFVYPLAAALLGCIYGYRHKPRLWLLAGMPVILLLWANMHGSWTLGILMLGIWMADETWRAYRQHGLSRAAVRFLYRPGLALLAAAGAVLVNPRGVGIIAYVIAMAKDPASQIHGTEWVAPTFDDPLGAIFLAGLMLAAVLLAISPRRPDLFQVLTFLAFGLLGLQMVRASVWFGFTMAPVVAFHLSALLPRRVPERKVRVARWQAPVNALTLIVVLLIGILSLPWFKHLLPLPRFRQELVSNTPVAAVEYLLVERPAAPLFNENGFGSYLIWAASPAYKVFADPRLELYDLHTWEDYLLVTDAECGWDEKLASYGVNTLLVSPTLQPKLAAAASASPQWRTLYEDEVAVILTRQE